MESVIFFLCYLCARPRLLSFLWYLQPWSLAVLQPLEQQGCRALHLKVLTIFEYFIASQECSITFKVWYLYSKYPHLWNDYLVVVCEQRAMALIIFCFTNLNASIRLNFMVGKKKFSKSNESFSSNLTTNHYSYMVKALNIPLLKGTITISVILKLQLPLGTIFLMHAQKHKSAGSSEWHFL